jgi:hypothetical protein
VILDDFQQTSQDGRCEISARVRRGSGEQLRLWWRFPEAFAPARVDSSPFLAGVLVWAMRHREDVTLEGPVSPQLLANMDSTQAVYRSMFPDDRRPISVRAPTGSPPPEHHLTGCFFSRGVDSWHAVLSALEDDPQTPPLTHLVFSPDFFPVDHWPPGVLEAKSRQTLDAARRTGCRVIEVETNLKRDFGGAQLTSTALALGFSRMLVAAGAMRGEIVPAGSHPALDYRFSTERTKIVHYGDASRLDKVARIAQSCDAMETLHVCRVKTGAEDENCCRCEKCLRTMLELHIVGALEGCPAFTKPLDPIAVARMRKQLGRRHQWVDAMHSLNDTAQDRRLAAAAALVIAQNDLRKSFFELRDLAADPALGDVAGRLPKSARRATTLSWIAHKAIDPDAPGRMREIWQRFLGAIRDRAARIRKH